MIAVAKMSQRLYMNRWCDLSSHNTSKVKIYNAFIIYKCPEKIKIKLKGPLDFSVLTQLFEYNGSIQILKEHYITQKKGL